MKTMIIIGAVHMAFLTAIVASFISPEVPGWIAPTAAGMWVCAIVVWALITGLCPEEGGAQ